MKRLPLEEKKPFRLLLTGSSQAIYYWTLISPPLSSCVVEFGSTLDCLKGVPQNRQRPGHALLADSFAGSQ